MKKHTILLSATLWFRAVLPAFAADPVVYDLQQLESHPSVISSKPPAYPSELRAKKVEGETVLSFVVDPIGAVRDLSVVRSTGPEFSQAAVDAVSQWRFKPGTKDGKSVACHVQIPIVFAVK